MLLRFVPVPMIQSMSPFSMSMFDSGIAVAYPSYQVWLALVSDTAGASGRILLSVPVGAVCLAMAFAVLSRLWRKAGADA